jgi:hypothetical protein
MLNATKETTMSRDATQGGMPAESTKPDARENAADDETIKAKADFARYIYSVADARISAYDNQAGVLVAAAIAVAGFGVSSWSRGGVHAGWFIAAAAAGLASILASVNARAVVPKLARWGVLHAKLHEARDAVAAALDLRTEHSAAVSQKKVFDAWYAISESSNKRRDAENVFYSAAVLMLVLELIFLVMALTTGTGSVVSG